MIYKQTVLKNILDYIKAMLYLCIFNVRWVKVYVGVAEVTVFIRFIRETESIGLSEAWPVAWQLKLPVQILHANDLIEINCI